MRTNDPKAPLFRVVEEVSGPAGATLHSEMVASSDGHPPISWNKRHRIYPRIQEARTYKARLAKEGRKARIFRFVYEGEVE